MLRRQLQRDGKAAQLCAGFDAETANAYLESALRVVAQQSYETHLAACTDCRQHVTALMRLNTQFAPAPMVAPAPAILPQAVRAVREPLWSQWLAPLQAWWAAANLSWGLTSAGALATVLLAVFAFNGWRQNKTTALSPVLTANKTIDNLPAAIVSADSQAPAALSESTVTAEASSAANAATVSNLNTAAKTVATTSAAAPNLPNLGAARPQITATGYVAAPATPLRVIDIPEDVIALNGEKVAAPVIALPGNRDFFGSGFSGNGGVQGTPVALRQTGGLLPTRLTSIEPHNSVSSLNVVKDQLERQASLTDLVADARSLPARAEADKNAKAAKSEPGRARAILNTLMGQRGALGFAAKGEEARTKEAEKTTDQPLIKPLTKRVNGHTFYFEHSYWIDENYKSDTTLPLVKLVRGSERFQNVLIENPTLEQFFQLGQVIVVWKGKVYEVRKEVR